MASKACVSQTLTRMLSCFHQRKFPMRVVVYSFSWQVIILAERTTTLPAGFAQDRSPSAENLAKQFWINKELVKEKVVK